MDPKLSEFVDKLKAAAGANLKSVVLYGSAASGEFREGYSDFNLLCVLEKAGARELEKLRPALNWWGQKGHRTPQLFSAEEVRSTLDVFPIEWLDMQTHRRVLHGEDPLVGVEVPLDLHRVQLERELRTQLLRLRHAFANRADDKEISPLMTNSASTFTALFRHVLLALGEKPPSSKGEAAAQLAGRLGFDGSPFLTVLEIRAGKKEATSVDARRLFQDYLDGIARVVSEVDRLFQAKR